ncbi:MAG: ABC transporter substrate-binding protein [Acidimicrobiia bacterium]
MLRRLLVAATALVLILAGCTGGDDDPVEPDTRTTTGVTDDEVIVRVPEGAEPHAVVGAAARIERTNREGGVQGRRVLLEDEPTGDTFALLPAADDSLDPAAGDDDGTTPDIVNRPVFGAAHNGSFCSVDYAFSVIGCQAQPSSIWGDLVALAGDFGDSDRTALVMALEGSAADLVVESFEAAGFTTTTVGDDVFDSVPSVVATVNEADPDVVVFPSAYEDTNLAAHALIDAGYSGVQTVQTAGPPPPTASGGRGLPEGTTVLTDFSPFESADENPIVQRLIDDVREYEETKGLDPTPLSDDLAAGYWAADAFLDVLDATGSDLTVERFLQRANDDFEWQAEATAGPASWPRNHRVPVPCGSLVRYTADGTETAVGYSCGRNLT